MSDTPETDYKIGATYQGVGEIEIVQADFAKHLEISRNLAVAEIARLTKERDFWQSDAVNLAYQIGAIHQFTDLNEGDTVKAVGNLRAGRDDLAAQLKEAREAPAVVLASAHPNMAEHFAP